MYGLEEGVWSLGGEAGFVLATENPVGQRELDLGVLQREGRGTQSVKTWQHAQINYTYKHMSTVLNGI